MLHHLALSLTTYAFKMIFYTGQLNKKSFRKQI